MIPDERNFVALLAARLERLEVLLLQWMRGEDTLTLREELETELYARSVRQFTAFPDRALKALRELESAAEKPEEG